MGYDVLLERAAGARSRALAPVSGFKVGAALLCASGRVFEGCNIENRTLNLGLCAERVALLSALSAGERRFEAIAVAARSDEPVTPCGACRQLLWEFAGDMKVICTNLAGATKTYSMAELIPAPFTAGPAGNE